MSGPSRDDQSVDRECLGPWARRSGAVALRVWSPGGARDRRCRSRSRAAFDHDRQFIAAQRYVAFLDRIEIGKQQRRNSLFGSLGVSTISKVLVPLIPMSSSALKFEPGG